MERKKSLMQINNKLEDIILIKESLQGIRTSLEKLIIKYKDWLFNLAIRMVGNPTEAEDVTQEILIKIITQLNRYDVTRASFKTWIYRIAVNYILNMKKRGYEKSTFNFDNYYDRMDFIQDITPELTPKIDALIQDTMINCVMATLICLNRKERLVIIIGVIFNINSKIGGEIMGIKPDSFRKILSRSRNSLKKFMSTTCSLVNSSAKCKCKMKITDLIAHGYRNPDKLIYSNLKYDKTVRDVIGDKVKRFMNKYFYKFNDLFQSQPFWNSPDMLKWLDQNFKSDEFKEIFSL